MILIILVNCRTPPYKNPGINSNVDVCFELYRSTASNEGNSEPVIFTYHPDPEPVGYSPCMASVSIRTLYLVRTVVLI